MSPCREVGESRDHPPSGGRSWLLVVATVLACGDSGPSEPSVPPAPADVNVSPGSVAFAALGDAAQLTATVLDQNGQVMQGQTVTWASSAPAVAVVDASGLVTAAGNGAATITATAGRASGNADVSVQQVAARIETVAGDNQSAPPYSVVPVNPAVRLSDGNGHPVEGATVAFRVIHGGGSLEPTAAVTVDGIASTAWTLGAPGEQKMVATTDAGSDSLTTEFAAMALGLTVHLAELPDAYASFPYAASSALSASGGSPPYVWDAPEGGLPDGLALTGDGRFDGAPGSPGTFRFVVRATDSNGLWGSVEGELHVCGPELDLPLGEPHVIPLDGSRRCGFILRADAAGSYFRVTTVGTREYRFDPPDTMTVEVLHRITDDPAGATSFGGTGLRVPDPEEVALSSDGHSALREAEARLLRELAARGRLDVLRDRSPAAGRAAVRAAPPPDTLVVKRGRPGSLEDNCTVDTLITTVLVGHTDRLAAYATPGGDPLHADSVARILRHYDDHGAEVIDAWGGVSDLDGNERINVYFDADLAARHITGLVWAGDFLSGSACPASNAGELMRIRRDWVNRNPIALQSTVVHEAQHLNSLYKRISASGNLHPIWIEEGRAVLAEEVAARMAWWAQGGPAPNETVTAGHTPRLLGRHTDGLFGLKNALSRTKYVFTAQPHWIMSGPDPYGGGWNFHRFLADRYGGAGGAPRAAWDFLRTLMAPETPTGVAGLVAVTGRSFEELMTDYAVAFSLAGTGAPVPPEVPVFATHDFTGLGYGTPNVCCRDVPGRFPWPVTINGDEASARLWAPLSETRTFSGVSGTFRVHDLRASEAGESAIVRIRNRADGFRRLIAAVVIMRIPDQSPAVSASVTGGETRSGPP